MKLKKQADENKSGKYSIYPKTTPNPNPNPNPKNPNLPYYLSKKLAKAIITTVRLSKDFLAIAALITLFTL